MKTNTLELRGTSDATKAVPWNFTMWIVDENGKVLAYVDPSKYLSDYTHLIVRHLNENKSN